MWPDCFDIQPCWFDWSLRKSGAGFQASRPKFRTGTDWRHNSHRRDRPLDEFTGVRTNKTPLCRHWTGVVRLSPEPHRDRRPEGGIYYAFQEIGKALLRFNVTHWMEYCENTQNKPTSPPNWHAHKGRNKGTYLWASGSVSLRSGYW